MRVRPWWAALIAALLVAAVGFGGVHISAASSAASGDQRVQQLVGLGKAVSGIHGLASAIEDEADVTAQFVAGGSSSGYDNQLPLQAHYAITNLAAMQVQALDAKIGAGYPAQVLTAVAAVNQQVQGLKLLREQTIATNAPQVLGLIESYTHSADVILSLDGQIAAASNDPQLAAGVRALGTLTRAENAASEDRAILSAVLAGGSWQPGEAAALAGTYARETAAIAQFRSEVPSSEFSSYLATVNGQPASTADAMLSTVLKTGQRGAVPVNPPGSRFPTALKTWDEGMTYQVDQMREVEQNMLSSIQSRSQVLHNQAGQAVTNSWIEAVGSVLLVVAIAVFAARRSSPSRRVHWI